jgi:hypothetical protein
MFCRTSCVFGRGTRLVQPPGLELAGLQQHDRRLLRRSARGGDREVRGAGDLQYRPGIAVYCLQLYPSPAEEPNPGQTDFLNPKIGRS